MRTFVLLFATAMVLWGQPRFAPGKQNPAKPDEPQKEQIAPRDEEPSEAAPPAFELARRDKRDKRDKARHGDPPGKRPRKRKPKKKAPPPPPSEFEPDPGETDPPPKEKAPPEKKPPKAKTSPPPPAEADAGDKGKPAPPSLKAEPPKHPKKPSPAPKKLAKPKPPAPKPEPKPKPPAPKLAEPPKKKPPKAVAVQPPSKPKPAPEAPTVAQLQKQVAELSAEVVALRAKLAASEQPAAEPTLRNVVGELTRIRKHLEAEPAAKPKPRKPSPRYVTLDLSKRFNNDGITNASDPRDSTFDEWQQSYIGEDLPSAGLVYPLAQDPGLPFLFPSKKDGASNNVALDGQRLKVPGGAYHAIHLLGAATDGHQTARLRLVYDDDTEARAVLKLSDWCALPEHGERQAFFMSRRRNYQFIQEVIMCSMWVQTLRLEPAKRLKYIVFPQDPNMHIFAVTLDKAQQTPQPADLSDPSGSAYPSP